MKSLLRYPGGKSKAVKILYELIPKGTKKVISPFLGGGSFELFLCENGIEVEAYDKFYELFCFWDCLLNNKKELYEKVKEIFPMTKEKFYDFKKLDFKKMKEIEVAAIFYALNRSSFSGSTLSGGISPGCPRFNEYSIERINKFEEKNIKVKLMDFQEVIKENNNENLLFLDPPYYIEYNLYGKKGDMHKNFEHEILRGLLSKETKFILCYNDCEYIRNLYKEFDIKEASWSYGMNKSKKSKEIIISNLI